MRATRGRSIRTGGRAVNRRAGDHSGTRARAYPVRVSALGEHNLYTTVESHAYRRASVAPQLSITTGSISAREGQPFAVSGTVWDSFGPVPMTLTLRWGDDPDETVALAAGQTTFSVSHTYYVSGPNGVSYFPYYNVPIMLTILITADGRSTPWTSTTVAVADVAPGATLVAPAAVSARRSFESRGARRTAAPAPERAGVAGQVRPGARTSGSWVAPPGASLPVHRGLPAGLRAKARVATLSS
jgi:hypothetical protein